MAYLIGAEDLNLGIEEASSARLDSGDAFVALERD